MISAAGCDHSTAAFTDRCCCSACLSYLAICRRAIPEAARYGSRFVFRQGNPLVVADLHMVAAARASAAIVVSDASRCPEEADAQSLRCGRPRWNEQGFLQRFTDHIPTHAAHAIDAVMMFVQASVHNSKKPC